MAYKNPEDKEAYNILYRARNRGRLKLEAAERNQRDPEGRAAICEKYRNKNRDKIRRKHKIWRDQNPERLKLMRKRANAKPKVKLGTNLRCRIRQALKNTHKSASLEQLLGCSIIELREHLESLFQPGMTWDNYGFYGWHIDHIKPCAKFDLTDELQQRLCFHWTNLQPLWQIQNLKKGSQ